MSSSSDKALRILESPILETLKFVRNDKKGGIWNILRANSLGIFKKIPFSGCAGRVGRAAREAGHQLGRGRSTLRACHAPAPAQGGQHAVAGPSHRQE
jgi:hypothetical protein